VGKTRGRGDHRGTACPGAGKYKADNLPGGQRSFSITAERVQQIEPLISLMREVGAAHGGKTPGQVISPDLHWAAKQLIRSEA
jgi:hypothetical protein